jgi:endonuclease I
MERSMTKKKKKKKTHTIWESSQDLINLKKQLTFLKVNTRKIQEDHGLYFDKHQNLTDIQDYYQIDLHLLIRWHKEYPVSLHDNTVIKQSTTYKEIGIRSLTFLI